MSLLPRIVRNFGRCCHAADSDDAAAAAGAGTGTAAAHSAADDAAAGRREVRLLAGLLLQLLRLVLHFYDCAGAGAVTTAAAADASVLSL